MSQIKSYTTNFSMKIPEFNIATWHDAMEYNFTLIDALLGNFFEINNFKGPWLIVTGYQANDIVYINDEDDQYVGKIFKVLQNHVSGNTKFETFYTAHPEYYEEYADMNGVVNYFNLAKDYAIKTNGKVVENGVAIDYSAKYYANQSANSATLANNYKSDAFTYKTDAESAKNSAQSYANNAQGYMNNAQQYKDDAYSSKLAAAVSENNAASSATAASGSATSAANSVTSAQTAESNAQGYANSASSSASAASSSANDALGYKNDAYNSAQSAASYDTTYQQYLQDAQTASTDAQTYASGAQTAKDNAVTWAQGTDVEVGVLGGEHSAKGWAGVIKTILANIVCNTTTIDPGDPAEVTSTGDEDEIILNFFIPQGLKGDTGDQGIQGIPGQDGADGQDGFSPSATVTQSGNVTTITITDKDGTTTESIDLSGYETVSNKVTSISALSTDTQYPSAKCVWDIVGDIESTINTIRGV